MDYTEKQIEKIIKNYNTIQQTIYNLDQFEEIICITSDVNAALIILTDREQQVIKTIMEYGEKKSAELCNISINTVRYYVTHSSKKIHDYLEGVNHEVLHKRNDKTVLHGRNTRHNRGRSRGKGINNTSGIKYA